MIPIDKKGGTLQNYVMVSIPFETRDEAAKFARRLRELDGETSFHLVLSRNRWIVVRELNDSPPERFMLEFVRPFFNEEIGGIDA